MSETQTISPQQSAAQRPATRNYRWRVVDIIVMAVLAVLTGAIFAGWNIGGVAWMTVMESLTPGLGGLALGGWLIGGVLGGLIIGKPGAALLVELLAAFTEVIFGAQWGWAAVTAGLAQGLAAELIFLATGYRKFTLPVALLAGAAAGFANWVLGLITSGNLAKGLEYNAIYVSSAVVSGIVIAGLVGWLFARGLASTGALRQFPLGRLQKRV